LRSPVTGIDYTDKDYEAFRAMMLEKLGAAMPEYTDTRQSDAGIVLLELVAQGLDILSFYQDVIANECFLETAEQYESAAHWAKMLGYSPRFATPAHFRQVFRLLSPQQSDTLIPKGTAVRTEGSGVEPAVYFETASDLTIPAGLLGDERTGGEYDRTADIVQGQSVANELLGTSSGAGGQRFALAYSPAIVSSIQVLVNEGLGFSAWERVASFIDSGAASEHYAVELGNEGGATIVFGDGSLGKIPGAFQNGIYAAYRVGGGSAGNVAPMKICAMDSPIALVGETFNPYGAYSPGTDRESIGEIRANAPSAVRLRWGALTLRDFSDILLMRFGGDVLMAQAEREENIDDLRIYVWRSGDALVDADFIGRCAEIFDIDKEGRKIVGAGEISIQGAVFEPLSLEGSLVVKDGYSRAAVSAAVIKFADGYFAHGSFPMGGPFIYAELAARIMDPSNVAGVMSFAFGAQQGNGVIAQSIGHIFELGGQLALNSVTGGVE
jgi:hypothetical protein